MVPKRLLLVLLAMVVAGCAADPFDALDKEAAELIQRRNRLVLGPEAQFDPNIIPQRTVPPYVSPRVYEEHPGTLNPGVSQLPVHAATTAPAGPGGSATRPATAPAEGASTQPSTPGASTGELVLNPPGAVEFDLTRTFAYGIEHSPDYRRLKEDVFLKTMDLLTQWHAWGPLFFDKVTQANLAGTPEAGDHDQLLTLINQFGVTQNLPYGGTVSATAVATLVDRLRNVSTAGPHTTEQSQMVLSANVPLLQGAGLVAREPLIQAERNLIYQVRAFERTRRQFLVDVATKYYNLLQQQSAIANRQQQLANYDLQYRRMDSRARAGREPYFNVEQSQQQVLFARNDLLNAQEQYATSLDSFKIFLGMPVAQPLKILPTEFAVPTPALDFVEAIQTALQLRLDLQTKRDSVDDARRGVENARNNMLPKLDLTAEVDLNTDPGRHYGGLALRPGASGYSIGITTDNLLDRRNQQIAYRTQLVTLERAQRDYTLLRDQVALAVRSDIRGIEQARFTLELQKRNVEIADRRVIGVKLKERTLTPRDMIDAQTDWLNARNLYDAAVRDLRVSILQYLLDTDQLRVTSQGQWEPPPRLTPAATQPATQPAVTGVGLAGGSARGKADCQLPMANCQLADGGRGMSGIWQLATGNMHSVFIAIGSNLGDRAGHVARAREGLARLPRTRLVAFSPIYETEPVGPAPQGRYLNAAAWLESELEPAELWAQLAVLEAQAGRPPREQRLPWGPRPLDLDILLYGARVLAGPDLVVPHPRMHERWFVLRPLADIAPEAVHPVLHLTVAELLRRVGRSD